MRSFVLMLLLANVVFFLYTEFVEQPSVDTGVVVRDEAELVPLAEMIEPPPPPAEPPAPACYRIEYFETVEAAQSAMQAIDGIPGDWVVEEATQDVFVGYWVQVTDLRTRAEADTYQRRLQDGGVEESYRVGDDTEGYALSLGLFSERERAERVLGQAQALNVPAAIYDRTRPEPAAIVTIDLADAAALDAVVAGNDALVVTDCDAERVDAAVGSDPPEDSEAEADPE
ncbi:MAG: SPOR domain-containing protein [Pseudomonadota bacterium]